MRIGTAGNDVIPGTPEDDILRGLGGDDRLDGIDGNDRLKGGAGNDRLIGGAGVDTPTGGAGRDRFVFRSLEEIATGASNDVVEDLIQAKGDRIVLKAIDPLPGTAADDAFTFIGSAAISAAGQIRYEQDGTGTTVLLSVDDQGMIATDTIRLGGLVALTAADFGL